MYKILKRLLDFIFALVGLVVLLVPSIIVGIIVAIDSKASPLFLQKRYGKNKKYFTIIKFRTMKKDTDPNVATLDFVNPKASYTKCGGFLRKTHIDEWPQLLNILVGHMSFVGPRPALWNQDNLIKERDAVNANTLTPGLTGLAQVSMKDVQFSDKEKAELDGVYVKKMSLWLDIKIVFQTFFNLFK